MYAENRQIPAPERFWTWLRYTRPSGARTFPRVALLSRKDEPPDYLVEPIMRFAAQVGFHYTGAFPVIDTALTMQVLFGILGLGALRSYDKKNGAAK